MGRDRGWKTLTEALDKPRKSARKLQKKVQVTGFDLFSVQVTDSGLKSVSCSPGHRFCGKKCDLQLRVSRRQISEKVVVCVAAGVGYLRNRARNTRKLKIVMLEGFIGKK